jgi:hypothetical protein
VLREVTGNIKRQQKTPIDRTGLIAASLSKPSPKTKINRNIGASSSYLFAR